MSFAERAYRLAALLALASAWLWHFLRAILSAVTTDEAFTALDFAGKPWLQSYVYYDANNHVLHTILVKLSLDTFGWHALSLRLPVLLSGILYLCIIWLLGRRWFSSTPALVAFCALAAWMPPVAEYYSLARGYALALTFFTWALYEADFPGVARWHRVSLAMGLSVASNLVFAIPCSALACVLLIRERGWRDLPRLAAPAFVAALVVNSIPLSRAEQGNFYFGARGPWESIESVLQWPGFDHLTVGLVILLSLGCIFALTRAESRWLAYLTLLTIATIVILSMAGVPWPRGRTGIYVALLLLLTTLRWVLCIDYLAWPILLLIPVAWVALPLRYHPEWHFDASSRIIAQQIVEMRAPSSQTLVAAEFPLNYAIAFHCRELAGSSVLVVRADAVRSKPAFSVTSRPPGDGRGQVVLTDPATSVTLVRIP